jgi:hypothetical protein
MRTYTFIIGGDDDFESVEDLMEYIVRREESGWEGTLLDNEANYSIHEFSAPDECDEEMLTMIGRGFAFSGQWRMSHTFSFLLKGPLRVGVQAQDRDYKALSPNLSMCIVDSEEFWDK